MLNGHKPRLILAGMVLFASACSQSSSTSTTSSSSAAPAQPAQASMVAQNSGVDGLIDEYCTGCHNFEDYSGGVDLEGLGPDNIHIAPEVGEQVIKRLRAGMMPPVGEPRPDVETMQALARALEQDIDRNADIEPGRPLPRAGSRRKISNRSA